MAFERLRAFLRRRKKKIKILALIDFENLLLNVGIPVPNISFSDAFDALIRELVTIGEVAHVFVFAPLHIIAQHLETFQNLGFFPVPCLKKRDKKDSTKEIDTVDEILQTFARQMIPSIPDLTHICLGSGDRDFAPFLREAKRRGLRTIVVSGRNVASLSGEILNLADKHPETGKKMVFLFPSLTPQ